MPPMLRFLISRIFAALVTLLVITAVLYGIIMLTPAETRAELYMTKGNAHLSEEQYARLIEQIIKRHHLRDPFPVQYAYWIGSLIEGNWGYSPVLQDNVLNTLVRRSKVTAELTIYSLLFFIPLGLISGVIAGSKKDRGADHRFRTSAFIATSMPPFILALILISIFYVQLGWFPIERLSLQNDQFVKSEAFRTITGFITIDGLLNQRPDISLDAARHLVLPVITLSLVHWATLGRVTRATTIEELQKEYIVAGKARGISNRSLVWKHSFRNVMAPSVANSALSAAALFTGVFVIEVIFNLHGISQVVVSSISGAPDAPSALGYAIYSVLVVLMVMLILDILQAIVDPRIRQGTI
jgi:ABC-type dipeptide/oligopeptide/nickel transport system permease component